ncbi:uncharacterized protein LOC128230342 [Mya arenaria]|uniref:uncharacterized protein LOC128230342 n=1 Tax=Mya arenaria TaxID=6604 RepID=UPI0022E69997|nr:uncharacterized protein LOC128230342 [Mya arenaria]
MPLGRKGALRRTDGNNYGAIPTNDDSDSNGIGRTSDDMYGRHSPQPNPPSGRLSPRLGGSVPSRPSQVSLNNDKISKLKEQVNEVKGIMKNNIEKVIERGDKVEELSGRTENLAETSVRFRSNATDLRKSTQCMNRKLICCIVCVVVVVVTAVTLIVLFSLKVI